MSEKFQSAVPSAPKCILDDHIPRCHAVMPTENHPKFGDDNDPCLSRPKHRGTSGVHPEADTQEELILGFSVGPEPTLFGPLAFGEILVAGVCWICIQAPLNLDYTTRPTEVDSNRLVCAKYFMLLVGVLS